MSTRTEPEQLGVLTSPFSDSGTLRRGSNNQDVFAFSLTQPTTITINASQFRLSSSVGSASINLGRDTNNNNNQLDETEITQNLGLSEQSPDPEIFKQNLPAGTYFVEVRVISRSSDPTLPTDVIYSLSINPSSGTEPTPSNPSINLSVSPRSVAEDGIQNLIYTFTRTGSTVNALTVNFTVGGTATYNTDYTQSGATSFTRTSGSIRFSAGSNTANLTINPSSDTTIEADETVSLTLRTGTGYTVNTTSPVTGTITNDDLPPSDLTGTLFNIVPTFLFAGDTFPVELTIRNVGGIASGAFNVDFYLSTNSVINSTDARLTSVLINSLSGNTGTGRGSFILTLPEVGNSLWRGNRTYYIGMLIDSNNNVRESNENNNSNLGNLVDYEAIEIFPIDAAQYGASNPDLIQAFSYNIDAFKQHYINNGRLENRSVDSFEPYRYLASNLDLIPFLGINRSAAIEHYIRSGIVENRSTTAFSPAQYLASNSDLIRVLGYNLPAASLHYLQFGLNERRSLDNFDELTYVASNLDLIPAFRDNGQAATQHYIQHGFAENRSLLSFKPSQYLASQPDLLRAFGNNPTQATLHFINRGFDERRSPDSFDEARYLLSHDDLLNAFGTDTEAATQHYLNSGFQENRDINKFQSDNYIASYPDLIQNFRYNLELGSNHYLNFGRAEQRQITFNPQSYLDRYIDLEMAFKGDLVAATRHFIEHGFFEDRMG
jgi:hypothetical protein